MVDFKLKLHHIGVATKCIEKEFKAFQALGYVKRDELFEDSTQKIRGLFIEAENQPCMELLEGLTDDNPIKNHILKGNKFYHIAYETKNIEKDLKIFIEEKRAKVIVPITEATYFDKICFMVMPNMMLIELVQLKELNNG